MCVGLLRVGFAANIVVLAGAGSSAHARLPLCGVCKVFKRSKLTLCGHQQGNPANDRVWDEQLKIRIESSRFKPAWYPARLTATTTKHLSEKGKKDYQ